MSSVRCMSAGSPEHVTVEEDPDDVRYHHTIRSGRHVLKGDLAPESGGTDEGPSPKELLMSGLGLCTSMTIRMYADRKKWPLERVNVEVREFTKPGAHVPEELLVTVHLTGPQLTYAQRARLHEIGDRCPVKRMIKGEMPKGISSVLAGRDLDHVIE
ncbi:hypothetical protein KFL_001370240 [Klebsormidium nitens]|uniref:Uncharacterized protein n=1 Tax=Klebsormidium nitens TaxID=105231 RepID=A0A1Y1HWW9_KLENI|nr:hypothetical protein KFL_001370240 [Klebsormidium nitens]|eukprot:GAQ83154.1 hypothetical protein KFL_001370240 [Klebsormidium nitens]